MGDTSGRFVRFSRRCLGFTLIEIMIVLAVVGIIAMVTVPRYQGLTDHYHLESSAQLVLGQLRFAKQLAMDRRENVYVVFEDSSVSVLDKGFSAIDSQRFDSGVLSVDNGFKSKYFNSIKDLSGIDQGIGLHYNMYGLLTIVSDATADQDIIVQVTLTSGPSNQSVYIKQTLADLTPKIFWSNT